MKIGELRVIPKGTKVWVIALQENMFFEKDVIVEITHRFFNNNKNCFGKLKLVLFEYSGIPGLVDKANGDIMFSYNETKPYKLPKSKIPII